MPKRFLNLLCSIIKQLFLIFIELVFPTECIFCGKYGKILCDRCYKWLPLSIPECYVCRQLSKGSKTHHKCTRFNIDFENKDRKIILESVTSIPESIQSKSGVEDNRTILNGVFSRVFVGWQYNKVAKVIMKQFKFSGAFGIADFLSKKLSNRLNEIGFFDINFYSNSNEKTNDTLVKNDHIQREDNYESDRCTYNNYIQEIFFIPIPLHKKKLKSRGFNQSKLITERLAKIYYMHEIPKLLEKVIDNKTQSHLKVADRMKNAENLFQVDSAALQSLKKYISFREEIVSLTKEEILALKYDGYNITSSNDQNGTKTSTNNTLYTYRLIVVDDVISTGHTLESAGSQILKSIFADYFLSKLYYDNRLVIEAVGLFRGSKVISKNHKNILSNKISMQS